jgi:hypothetical protein
MPPVGGLPRPFGRPRKKAAGRDSDGLSESWLQFIRKYRNLCMVPTPEVKAVFDDLRVMGLVG